MSRDAPVTSASLHADFERLVAAFTGCLAGLLVSLGLDTSRPREIAATLDLDHTLAWRTCRFVGEGDALHALSFLPRQDELGLIWSASARRGASPSVIAEARAAAEELHSQMLRHGGSRAGFRRLLVGLDGARERPRLTDDGRRQAFAGNAAIWGVQASARLGLHVVAPSAGDPTRLDLATVGGLHELHRLRAGARWPIVRHTSYGRAASDGATSEPLDPEVGPGQPPLVRAFCSDDLPPLRAVASGASTLFELGEGSLGQTAAVTCLFGFLLRRAVPRVATEGDEWGEFLTFFNTPVERAQVDLAVHRSLDFGPPEFQLCSLMESVGALPDHGEARYLLPISEQLTALDERAPVLQSACLPRYRELVRFTTQRMGHALQDFRYHRLTLNHPPIPSVAILRQRLPPA